MFPIQNENTPVEQILAVAHSSGEIRERLEAFLALDRRLASFVSQSKEAILTQMRIAWWRDQFAKPINERPSGDPILDSLSRLWIGEEPSLIALVDGWEALLAEAPLPAEVLTEFADGRAGCFAAMARLCGCNEAHDAAANLGKLWAFADLAASIGDTLERKFVIETARSEGTVGQALPYKLRSLTILGSLGRRAVENSNTSLITNKSDILYVMRVGMFGR